LRKLGCALTLKEKNKQIANRRYVGFLASVASLKSQFPPKQCRGQIPGHKEIKKIKFRIAILLSGLISGCVVDVGTCSDSSVKLSRPFL
jgi:hypothetical protein